MGICVCVHTCTFTAINFNITYTAPNENCPVPALSGYVGETGQRNEVCRPKVRQRGGCVRPVTHHGQASAAHAQAGRAGYHANED